MILILFFLMLLYVLAIVALVFGFDKVKTNDFVDLVPKNYFSIIVPFRNEAENLPMLLASFEHLNYPKELFEVILVDDFSDQEFQVCHFNFKISVLKNIRVSNSPKKDAILTAIQSVTSEWIITTDADCMVNNNWLSVLDNCIQLNNVSMIAGPVSYIVENTFLHHFQQMDLISLQAATIGSFGLGKGFMCNGANFAYTKSLFNELNGFVGNDLIASGDDVFLLQKAMARCPEKVCYLNSKYNLVQTRPLNNWKSLFFQRVRWASKTGSFQSKFGLGLGFIVFFANLTCLLVCVFGFLGWISIYQVLIVLLAKFVVDTVLVLKFDTFFEGNSLRYWFVSSLFYPFFSVSVAWYSLYGKYERKGRRF